MNQIQLQTLRPVGLLALLGALFVQTSPAQQPEEGNCVTCHRGLGIPLLTSPVEAFAQDVHAASGLGCVACHGGDPTAAGLEGMDPAKGFVAKPEPQDVAQFCGRCHADGEFMKNYNPSLRVDQVSEYLTSVHGKRLVELGDTNVATCISCHPAHSIRPPSDPQSSVHPLNVAETCGVCHADAEYMASYPIPHNQLEQYQESIHWQKLSVDGDLSAPTCNDCHGNHGAAPPGVSWVGNVCGQCHSVLADYYADSRHASVFTMLGVPGCATCHNNHNIHAASDEMLGLGEGAVCARCHQPDVGGGVVATTMRSLIDSLAEGIDSAATILRRAENAGMEVSQAQFELGGAQNSLVQARAAVHAFDVDSVLRHAEEGIGIAEEAQARGTGALAELQFRRTGLAVSVTIILALIAGLLLKIREIERKKVTT